MKQVHKCYYVHISAIKQLEDKFGGTPLFYYLANSVINDFRERIAELGIYLSNAEDMPIVIKYDIEKDSITMLYVADWLTAKEPEINGAWLYKMKDRSVSYIKGRGQIYHSKELFVLPTYKAFDLEKARQRTKEWNRYIQAGDKSRIGYKKYWKEFLKRNGMEL